MKNGLQNFTQQLATTHWHSILLDGNCHKELSERSDTFPNKNKIEKTERHEPDQAVIVGSNEAGGSKVFFGLGAMQAAWSVELCRLPEPEMLMI